VPPVQPDAVALIVGPAVEDVACAPGCVPRRNGSVPPVLEYPMKYVLPSVSVVESAAVMMPVLPLTLLCRLPVAARSAYVLPLMSSHMPTRKSVTLAPDVLI